MLKLKNDFVKPAFSIAEVLLTMFVVALVAVALVPMIGPNKTKAPRQKMIHGYYACYWKQTGADTYELYQNDNGKVTKLNSNYCEYKPPVANFYTVTVLGASGNGYGYEQNNMSDVYWKQSSELYGAQHQGVIQLNNFAQGYSEAPDLVQALIDKVIADEGPLAAAVTLTSTSGGPGRSCEYAAMYDATNPLGYVQTGDDTFSSGNYPGQDGGNITSMNVYFWVTPTSNISFGGADQNADNSVVLNVDDKTFTLSAAGAGQDAYSVYNHLCTEVAPISFLPPAPFPNPYYTLDNGISPAVSKNYDPSSQVAITKHETLQKSGPHYDQNTGTIKDGPYEEQVNTPLNVNISEIGNYIQALAFPSQGLSKGTDSQATINGQPVTQGNYSGSATCTGQTPCDPKYTFNNQTAGTTASLGTAVAMNNFEWNYRDNGVYMRASKAGKSGESFVKIFSKIDDKLRMTPAKHNLEADNATPTKTKLQLVKVNKNTGATSLLDVLEVSSGLNAADEQYAEWPSQGQGNHYAAEFGPYPEHIFRSPNYGVISDDTVDIPVKLDLGYTPGRGGDGAYPFIDHLSYTPSASILDLQPPYKTKTLTDKGFNFDAESPYKCANGTTATQHSTSTGSTQYYCKAGKGTPGIVVITW